MTNTTSINNNERLVDVLWRNVKLTDESKNTPLIISHNRRININNKLSVVQLINIQMISKE